MKKFGIKVLGITLLMLTLALVFVGCDMKNTGYQVEYYTITDSTYDNRPSVYATDAEKLSYVKNSGGIFKKSTYWCNTEEGLRDFFTEKLGDINGIDSVIQQIQQKKVSTWWHKPAVWSITEDCWFFYVENRN